jgi:signal transduction histidine kinase
MAMRPLDRLFSIRAKLGAVIVFAVAVTILIMYVAVGFALRKSDRDRQFISAAQEATAVAAFAFRANGLPSVSLQHQMTEVSSPVVIADPASQYVYFQGFPTDAQGRLIAPTFDQIERLFQGRSSFDNGKVGTLGYVGVPVTRGQQIVGAVYIGYHVEGGGVFGAAKGTAHLIRSFWWQLLLGGAIAAFIALFLARILARGLTKPLRDMAQAASRMSRGDYRRVEVRSRDEVGRLAVAFNQMAGELEGVERLRRDLVANVSHELKTPISAIRARLENLLDGVEEPNPALLAVMVQQSERLSRLVEQLLDLSKLESGDVPLELEPVALGPLVQQVASEVAVARTDRGIEFRNEVPDDLAPVEADRERIHQVLFNLLDNAYRFISPGGVVTVRAVRENGTCEVTVEDDGPGVPPEHLPLIFERFYRVDPSRSREDGGTGIGLAISRSVVEAHGGRIWAESEQGHGARFRFTLPMARTPIDRLSEASRSLWIEDPVPVGRGARTKEDA